MGAVVVMPERFGLPAIPSRRVPCVRCGASAWLSLRAELTTEDVTLCVICAMAVIKPGDIIDPGPWVLDDLAETLRGEG